MSKSVNRLLGAVLAVMMLFSVLPSARAAEPAEPDITCSAAVVMDFETGVVLYAKDPDTLRVPASMTKVMTAYIIYEELHRGSFTMDTEVPISDWVAKISRDSVNYQMTAPLPYGGTVPVKTLLRLILIYSASASCVAMAEFISGTEEAFVERMNSTAARLGLDAKYINPHGHKLNYISARSQAELIRRFIMDYPEVLEITSETSVMFDGKEYRTTNHLLPGGESEYPGVDGFKTGYIRASGYCQAVTCQRDGRRLISVAMDSSNMTTRGTDNVKLLDYGWAKLATMGTYLDIASSWSRPAVETLEALDAELHTEGHTFRPKDLVTRAEFTAMLCSALEAKDALPKVVEHQPPEDFTLGSGTWPFEDIADCWAQRYIIMAWDRGMVNGVSDGRFSPDAPISRQEIMAILDRSIEFPDGNGLNFSDVGSISFWALEAAARLTCAGIFTGSNGLLNPRAYATRAEAAQIVARVVGRV